MEAPPSSASVRPCETIGEAGRGGALIPLACAPAPAAAGAEGVAVAVIGVGATRPEEATEPGPMLAAVVGPFTGCCPYTHTSAKFEIFSGKTSGKSSEMKGQYRTHT